MGKVIEFRKLKDDDPAIKLVKKMALTARRYEQLAVQIDKRYNRELDNAYNQLAVHMKRLKEEGTHKEFLQKAELFLANTKLDASDLPK